MKSNQGNWLTKRVLVRQGILRAQRIPLLRAQVINLHDDALGTGERGVVVIRVRLRSELEA